MKENTIIVPIIRSNNIARMLDTLVKFTPRKTINILVIDQNASDEAYLQNHHKVDFWIKSTRNMGFSKAMNTGIKLAQTPYITLANDDIEFMNSAWWQGIKDTFQMDHHIIAVNPMSPKEGSWGYGLTQENKDTWQPPDGYAFHGDEKESIVPKLPNGQPLIYKGAFSEEEYQFLVNSHPRYTKDTMVDAIAMWCTVFKSTAFDKIGLLDERFYPGGGEDYDMNARAYSCAWPHPREKCDDEYHYRMVSSTKSWVWHHWGQSGRAKTDDPIFASREFWNANEQIWDQGFDVWGHGTNPDGTRKPFKRNSPPFIDEI